MAKAKNPNDIKIGLAVAIVGAIAIAYCSIPSDNEIAAGPASIKSPEAFEKCRPQIESKLARPETLDFNLFDTTMTEDGPNARFSVTGTSENAFGTAMKFTAMCHFQGGELTSVEMADG